MFIGPIFLSIGTMFMWSVIVLLACFLQILHFTSPTTYMDSIYHWFEKNDEDKHATTASKVHHIIRDTVNNMTSLRSFSLRKPSGTRNFSMSTLPSKHTFDDYLVKKMLDNVNRLGKLSKLLLVGDSFFFKFPKVATKWTTLESKYGALNLGAPGERTEHILHRFNDGRVLQNITSMKPLVLGMIGASNVNVGDSTGSIINGIDAVIKLISKYLKSPTFVLVSVLPRGVSPFNRTITDLNRALAYIYRGGKVSNVDFVDFTTYFVHADNGSLKEDMFMFDRVHPSSDGQDTIMHQLQGYFDRLPALQDIRMFPTPLKTASGP